jgi:hypothetical protein
MKWLLPNAVAGAFAGFILGFLASLNLDFLGIDVSGWPVIEFGMVGAVIGSVVGVAVDSSGRARSVARWSVAMMATIGAVSFLAGFAGPIIFDPDSPQGPLLGIFCTGPLGALAGAILGALIGLVVPSHVGPATAS